MKLQKIDMIEILLKVSGEGRACIPVGLEALN